MVIRDISKQIEQGARIGKIFARWHLAIAITSECIFLIALKITTILSEKKKLNKLLATKMEPAGWELTTN